LDVGLRRGEIASLYLEDVDMETGKISVLGKGRTGKEPLTLPEETKEALRAWMRVRGETPGPLFPNFDRAGKGSGKPLTGAGIYALVRYLGKQVGIKTRPHGIRHTAITEALELSGGNYRAAQKFSRHADPRTLLRYDDNREDLGGKIAQTVAASFRS
jgi:integrase/recombinase XerC